MGDVQSMIDECRSIVDRHGIDWDMEFLDSVANTEEPTDAQIQGVCNNLGGLRKIASYRERRDY